MEHMNVVPMPDGYVRILPKRGYKLISSITGNEVSEAIVKESVARNFVAVKK